MPQDTRIALFLMGELVAALRANDPDLFKRWLLGGVQDLGEPAVSELLLDWLDPFLTVEEQDRLLGWHLGVSLWSFWGRQLLSNINRMGELIPSWNGDGVFTGRESHNTLESNEMVRTETKKHSQTLQITN